MGIMRVLYLAVATSGIASSAPAPNPVLPGHANPIFSSIYTRHQSTVTSIRDGRGWRSESAPLGIRQGAAIPYD